MVDRLLIGRALTNIIENALACDAGRRHADDRRRARTIAADRPASTLADTRRRHGRAALDRIFEPYFSTQATGTGLGLTIAKRNVEAERRERSPSTAERAGDDRDDDAADPLAAT